MKFSEGQNGVGSKARRGDSRTAIIEAAERLFLERGFGSVSMDELAEAAGVARRTLYNQFASKEEIFREMLQRVSGQLEHALPPGIETQGNVEEVLRLVAQGLSNNEIAGRLFVSPGTVKTHFQRIYDKLEARDRSAAVAIGLRWGFIE